MNQQLQDYIKQSKATGMSDEQIRQELSKVGWPDKDIEEAINLSSADLKESIPSQSVKKPSKMIWG